LEKLLLEKQTNSSAKTMDSFSIRAPTLYRFIQLLLLATETEEVDESARIYLIHEKDCGDGYHSIPCQCMEMIFYNFQKHRFAGWFFHTSKNESEKVRLTGNLELDENVAVNEVIKYLISLYGHYEGLYERLDPIITKCESNGGDDDCSVSRFKEIRLANKAFYQAYHASKNNAAVYQTTLSTFTQIRERDTYFAVQKYEHSTRVANVVLR
jgi:hypothetical protein